MSRHIPPDLTADWLRRADERLAGIEDTKSKAFLLQSFTSLDFSAHVIKSCFETCHAACRSFTSEFDAHPRRRHRPRLLQRRSASATKDASLTILRIVNKPTTPPIAYALDKKNSRSTDEFHISVHHLGGGTFDVSLLTIDNGVFQVLAPAGDTHLRGEDCVNHFVHHFARDFKRKLKKDLPANVHALLRPKTAGERAKRALFSTSLPPATTAFVSKSTATPPFSAFGNLSNDVQLIKRAASRPPSPVPPKKRRLQSPPSPAKSPSCAPSGTQPSSPRPEQRDSASSSSSSSSSRKAVPHSPAWLQQPTNPNEEEGGMNLSP
ncbi:hypothetical protein M407DRAFT_29718 [Tulasnella calospora MUT 4182]|uniref:Uncharacterized protein n=1 Tax=Tulasnella calospora MUT 4182 TaxID=1051891 RepID=A0A0C3Q9K1_9AGAM|nr:hypothetical protein M407DRAFT_29718 [Tulasnella calospora MUT 4182]